MKPCMLVSGCVCLAVLGVVLFEGSRNAVVADEKETSASVAAKGRTIAELPSYPLPDAVTTAIDAFAVENDFVILGEVHGTQEVPAMAASLLPRLSKSGYGVLALEIPKDELGPLKAWATGETDKVPAFFARPGGDGRGNIQLLALVRAALSPPLRWQLVCFDQTSQESLLALEEFERKSKASPQPPQGYSGLSADVIALWQKRNAAMTSNATSQLKQIENRPKVLAICGSLHSRVENRDESSELKRLWPSFATMLQRENSGRKVGSINVQFHSGGFFNNGKVHSINGRKLETAEIQPATERGYNWELNLMHATPATFLAVPADPHILKVNSR
ncbi:MAG: hypothetical protein V4719_02415 [Planctomycetota bacterium]